MESTTGDEVKLPCHVSPSATTNVTWIHAEILLHGPPSHFYIYVNGHFDEKVRRRYSIYNANGGDYSLKILNIKDYDSGHYRCYNQQLVIKNYLIYVNGKY